MRSGGQLHMSLFSLTYMIGSTLLRSDLWVHKEDAQDDEVASVCAETPF